MDPFAHGEWLADHVAGARAELRSEHGHVLLAVAAFEQIVVDLAAVVRRT